MTLNENHLGILRVLRQHPDATTTQMKRLTTARLGDITYYLDDLCSEGLASVREVPHPNGTRTKLWRAL